MDVQRQERKRGPKRQLVLADTNRARSSVLSCIKSVLYNKNMLNICLKLFLETMNVNNVKNVGLIIDWIEEWLLLTIKDTTPYYTDEGGAASGINNLFR